MIGKLLRLLGAGLAYFALGTVLAELVGLYLVWSNGGLASDRVTKAVAALQGVELPEPEAEAKEAPPQPTLEDIALARAQKLRQIEQREAALAAIREMIREERKALSTEKDDVRNQRQAFANEIATLHDTAIEQGRENARQLLEGLSPDKAKAQILKMLDDRQLDEVVLMFQQMSPAKRNKIANEFESEEDQQKLNEILQRTHAGVPDAEVANRAQQGFGDSVEPENESGEPGNE